MSTAVSPAANSTAASLRPWWRLHPFTWCVVLLTAGVLVLIIVPGGKYPIDYEHGWPWTHATRNGLILKGINASSKPVLITHAILDLQEANCDWTQPNAWSLTQNVRSFNGWALAGNIAVVCFALSLAALAGQRWVCTRDRWWQFRIRELLVLTALVACALGWWRANAREVQREQAALNAWPSAIGTIEYLGPTWLRKLVGAKQLPWLFRVTRMSCNLCPTHRAYGDGLEAVHAAEPIRKAAQDLHYVKVVVSHTGDSGRDPRMIVFPPTADTLIVHGLTHDALACICHLIGLKHIYYDDVADVDLLHLRRLTNLETLHLSGLHLTDDGLEHLVGLQHLQELTLLKANVTDTGIAQLRDVLPNLRISRTDTALGSQVPWSP